MQLVISLKVLFLIAVANGAPLVAKRLLGSKLDHPVDGGATLPDGQRLLGGAKTLRGVIAALTATALAAPIVGFEMLTGAILAAAAMAGDLCSSFAKRRLGLRASSKASGLDQVPEALLPALAAMWLVGLTFVDVLVVTVLFTLANMLGSRVLFRLRLRDRPY